jgi:hypothetical protein
MPSNKSFLNNIKSSIRVVIYYYINILIGYNSIFYFLAKLENKTYPRLPGHHHWSDDYILWCNYMLAKSFGDDITIEQLKKERSDTFKKTLKEFNEKMNDRDISGLL